MTAQQKNQQVNEFLEDMCIYGAITKKEIKEEKAKHPEKFIETLSSFKIRKSRPRLICIRSPFTKFRRLGIETTIEVKENPETQEADLTSQQFITNGMIRKKNMIC